MREHHLEQARPMPRIIRHPELRRGELLDCAQALFLARGYDNASLNDVIAEAGVSKGAFYHYFASKEALLEALAERLARQALADVQDILDDPKLDALTRLNAFMAGSRRKKIEDAARQWALFETLFRPENLVLFHRINAAASALFTPVLAKIVKEGVKQGQFRTFDAEGVAEMLLQLGSATRGIIARAIAVGSDAEINQAIRMLERRIKLYGIALDRIVGLADRSLRLTEPGYIRAVMMARVRAAPRRAAKRSARARG
jgi:AcrR family transcriptional regulator